MIGQRLSLRTPVLTGVFVWAMLFLGGCATRQVAMLDARWPEDVPAQVELTQVPFFPQEDFECGPASLAMVATTAGVQVTPEALVSQVYLPGRQGSLQPEMLAATRRQGLLAYPLKPQVEDVLREVAAGHPVLVFQNLAFQIYPVWHYAVVMGYDRARHVLLLHSGRTARMEISMFAFERTWARGQYWAMLALKPGQLPATAEPQTFTTAAAALERVHVAAAQLAFAAAVKRWPDDRAALLGVGNTAYALGQREVAAKAFRHAVLKHADFADGWNNLAQVLLELGRRQEARQAISKAVTLGGARLPAYLALQKEILSK
ncbi:MAG: PA2778 family cysteine peptidase [Rhodoferax sp.]|uniref:PA2778 family cysteine peptidase n=1 Tax=Rhodoferax sp. TaxID=50421 RepID=UPI002613DEEE|nr:PA2778 family cysteine peptidase [Rhodoferax sp.]MDD2882415.1 PA2778 family cysteine peptidase [Rhodoferax sp.]